MAIKGSKQTVTAKKLAANRANALKRCKPGSLMRQLLGHYKQSAQRRNLPFTLTERQFEALVQEDCFYCGQPPSRRYRPTRYKDCYLSSGVDRVDNRYGYEDFNCVSCCKTCNQFKSTSTVQQMLDVVKRIYDRHIGSNS